MHATEATVSGNINAVSLTLGSDEHGLGIDDVDQLGSTLTGMTEDLEGYADGVLNTFVEGQYTSDMTSIQDQIDGNITSWFYNYEPTLNNAPASEWRNP
jgi:hypothetical protein